MYKRGFKNSRRKNKFRPKRSNGQGRRNIKTFDPTRIIQNLNELEAPEIKTHNPKNSFSSFAINHKIKSNIRARGFNLPTPIQDEAIPEILAGKDVVGLANTGTGKTAAFLIPLLTKALENKRKNTLIIVPTRELAVQIEDELKWLAGGLKIFSAICIGGVSINGQISRLKRKPQFVIGTPGRLLDLNKQRKINFNQFSVVVLDEVDRMLDMGFVRDIEKMISQLPHNRQSLFFSATLGREVEEIMKRFTKNPVRISVKSNDMLANVKQEIVKVNGKSKPDTLRNLLEKQDFEKVLVFGRTKRGADKLFRDLADKGFKVATIHGNKSQNQRQRALDQFKVGKVNILIATDVVARGIDVDDISHVINYELPESYEVYLHRIGRTGRAGKKGTAITFVD